MNKEISTNFCMLFLEKKFMCKVGTNGDTLDLFSQKGLSEVSNNTVGQSSVKCISFYSFEQKLTFV